MAPWTPDQTRRALDKFMKARGLNTYSWCKKAHIPESTLRNFLKGDSESLTLKTLMKLATAENVEVGVIIGTSPSWTPEQRRAAEIAGRLKAEDQAAWLRWGEQIAHPTAAE